jgi:hypothetical protein
MKIDGHRRSTKFEDRGTGGGGGRGALPVALLFGVARRIGLKGTLILAVLFGVGYFLMPASIRQQLLGQVTGGTTAAGGAGKPACELSAENREACDFSRVVLASTEDVWNGKFREGALPDYGQKPGAYREPTLVVFSQAVSTGGCGNATSAVGPFYCPADRKLYIDPNFYGIMETRLKAPGDFAQAYVIAHEVGHHVQNLIGSSRLEVKAETANQVSVRVELQADCLAGVWGHSARASLDITGEDLKEALNAAHAIGDDSLGHADIAQFTHGSSEQRMRWFRRGYDSGDARQCDTFSVERHAEL